MTPLITIRIAMMGGVLLFGAASWVIHRAPDWTPANAVTLDSLALMARVVWLLVGAAYIFLFWRARSLQTPAQASTGAILAWALGETVGMLGGVVYFMSARPSWYIAGVAALSLSFLAFPGRRT